MVTPSLAAADVYLAVCTLIVLHLITRGAEIQELPYQQLFTRRQQRGNRKRPQQQNGDAIYLKDDENINASQNDSCDGHLCLHIDVEGLVGHRERHHLIILKESLNCDGDGVTGSKNTQTEQKNLLRKMPILLKDTVRDT